MVFLRPLEWIYKLGLVLDRKMTCPEHLPWPTISVGNIALGGRSKTPMVIHLSSILKRRGFEVIVLSRGYGRKSRDPVFLTPDSELPSADLAGDEPLEIFLRSKAIVLVGPNRIENAKTFANRSPKSRGGRRIAILDDGFQHWALLRDLDLVLLHREDLDDRVVPSGSLREEAAALSRSDFVLEKGADFEKELSFHFAPNSDPPRLGVLTTRAPSSRSVAEVQNRFPTSRIEEMHLPDHSTRTEMLRALEDFKGDDVLVGWKEIVKLLPPDRLMNLRQLDPTLELENGRRIRLCLAEVGIRFLNPRSQKELEAKLEKLLAGTE